MRGRWWVGITAVVALAACETNNGRKVTGTDAGPGGDAGPTLAPTVTAVSPTSGPTDGGTAVTISGTGFASGATVRFGGVQTSATVVSSSQVTAITPPEPAGAVTVEVVNPNNRFGSLSNGFTYTTATPSDTVIGYCDLQFPITTFGDAGAPLTLYGQVYVQGLTDTSSTAAGAGIVMQAAVGSIDGGLTWNPATFNQKVGNNDEFQWVTTYPDQAGTYQSAFRAQLNSGPWYYCETDGGFGPTLDVADLGTVTSGAAPAASVGYCDLQFPQTLQAAPDTSAGPIYGRVYVPNVTTAPGNQAQILGQVGFGPLGSVPSASWSWSTAAFNPTCTQCGNNYEYDGTIVTGATGQFALATRFSTDQGRTWTNCDTAGDATYEPSKQGTLTVAVPVDAGSQADAGLTIGYCDLQFPTTLEAAPGTQAGPVYGRVYVAGFTDASGSPARIEGEVGFGPTGSQPSDDGGWTWSAAAYNPTCTGCGNNYEYDGTLVAPGPGTYAMAYRFSLDNGHHFVTCDAAGDFPYQPANAGVLTVQLAPADAGIERSVGWCDVQFPATLDAIAGTTAGPVYGRVYVAGVTADGGNPDLILGQVGYGPLGTVPGLDAGWRWAGAAYNSTCLGCGNNYEYDGTFVAPSAGSYGLAFRFSVDNGVKFVDCDPAGDLPYNPADEATMVVAAPTDAGRADAGGVADAGRRIGWCDLQAPTSLVGATGSLDGPVYGRVLVAGLTDVGGDAGEILAQVGFGPLGSDPTRADAGWRWARSQFNRSCLSCGPNYEYDGTLTAPSPGSYALAYRFSLDQGSTFVDCDTAGDPTYETANEGTFTVSAPPVDAGPPDAGAPVDAGREDAGRAPVDAGADAGPPARDIEWCDLQFPSSLQIEPGTSSGLVYAQVYSDGVTTVSGNQAEILAQVGYGPTGSQPGAGDAGWTWTTASFNPTCSSCGGNNYEYDGAFTAPPLGTYAMAARFSGDHGAHWIACDTAGDASFNPANAGALTVRWVTVSWCDLQWPPTLTAAAGTDAGPIYGQVYWPGVTDSGGSPSLILAQVGLGPSGSDPTSIDAGWTWWAADYNPSCLDCVNNFEFDGYLTALASGTYDYVTRFSADDGGFWTACGLGGPWTSGGLNDAGVLTVP